MNILNKKIGIWGFGVLGRSALDYFYAQGAQLEVIDSKELSPHDQALLASRGISYSAQDITAFLERNDLIIPSSGIDLRNYSNYRTKWLTELDFFYTNWHNHKKRIIAITGSVGKTSITQILANCWLHMTST
jgi:UDP-N-acetylmuramoylalanine-D-glutamate ligase